MSDTNFSTGKIVGRDDLIETVAAARARGLQIVLSNGCFDMLHVGHVRYLEAAKKLGGLLVVAINSDKQVRRLKGAGRPLMPEAERAEIVSAFGFVDALTIFDEPTVEQVIEAIRPDIHAKGTDYSIETVPEREIVALFGGRVAIVGDAKDHSSSALIAALGKRVPTE